MALTNNFADGDATATVHSAHHNDLAIRANLFERISTIGFNNWASGDRVDLSASPLANPSYSNYTTVSNASFWVPVVVPAPLTISALSFTSGGASTAGVVIRGGVYDWDFATNRPATQLANGSYTTEAVSSWKDIPISYTFAPGIYCFAIYFPSTIGTVVAQNNIRPFQVTGSPSSGTTGASSFITATTNYSAGLPSTAPSGTLNLMTGAAVCLRAKVA